MARYSWTYKMGRFLFIIGSLTLGILTLVSCSGDDDDPTTAVPPVFSVTPVDLDYDASDSTYGDIIFIEPVIRPFGFDLGNEELLESIDYFTVPGAKVRAVTEGIVDTIVENSLGDYEIRVISIPGSDYLVIYDHVNDVTVSDASPVSPGDILGEAGNWNDFMRRTSLQVTTGEGANERSYCPMYYGDSNFVARHEALLAAYNLRNFEHDYDSLCLRSVVSP